MMRALSIEPTISQEIESTQRSKRLRVAYLVSEYPGISHTFILREVQRLRAMNFDLQVASINSCARPPSQLTGEERLEAEDTFYIKRAGVWKYVAAHLITIICRPRSYLRSLQLAIRLAGADLRRLILALGYFTEAVLLGRWMEASQLRHVHVHFANPAAQVALIASQCFPIRYSITVHGPDEFYDTKGQNLAEKIAGAAFICCISHFAISQLMMLSPPSEWHKFELAPLGVDPARFKPGHSRVASGLFEILCIGRLVAAKGQHVLVDAVHHLITKGISIRLRLVGDGPERNGLEREVARRGLQTSVIFEGAVNQDRIREFYAKADAFVLASFAEGVPVVLMEAMAMEIPCIATYVAGIPQLIRDDREGLLLGPSDVEGLMSAIERLIADPALRARLGAAGRARILKYHDLDSNVARLARVFLGRLSTCAVPSALIEP